jgi:hypothetical protein
MCQLIIDGRGAPDSMLAALQIDSGAKKFCPIVILSEANRSEAKVCEVEGSLAG